MTKHKIQMSKLSFLILSFGFILCFACLPAGRNFVICHLAFAQEGNRLVVLSKQIIEARTAQELYAPFEEIKDLYLKENKFTQFLDYLDSLGRNRKELEPFIDYYSALTRYQQLKFLEANQSWDEYFTRGASYRDKVTVGTQKAIQATSPTDTLHIYARLLAWQFHREQQDVFAEQSFSDLLNSVAEYAKGPTDIKPIKEVADKLFTYGEKAKARQLYKVYAGKIVASGLKDDELRDIAAGFYKEGNLELAEPIYDAYIDRIANAVQKEKIISGLAEIARVFAYQRTGPSDMLYAEKIFQKIEETGGRGAFDEGLMYLRCFNLEKAKEYKKAKDLYEDLLALFPLTTHSDEATYKIGIIHTYILRDLKAGREYFERLAQKKELSPQSISGLYQLGLLAQWQSDLTGAKEYYNKLIGLAGNNFADTAALARERLKEIEEGRVIEYNLKAFLDVALEGRASLFDAHKLELDSSAYKAKKDESINISSLASAGETGCMQVELQYLWSGHTGSTGNPALNESSFNTSYIPGTKEINLVVVSASGVIDHNIEMVDIY